MHVDSTWGPKLWLRYLYYLVAKSTMFMNLLVLRWGFLEKAQPTNSTCAPLLGNILSANHSLMAYVYMLCPLVQYIVALRNGSFRFSSILSTGSNCKLWNLWSTALTNFPRLLLRRLSKLVFMRTIKPSWWWVAVAPTRCLAGQNYVYQPFIVCNHGFNILPIGKSLSFGFLRFYTSLCIGDLFALEFNLLIW